MEIKERLRPIYRVGLICLTVFHCSSTKPKAQVLPPSSWSLDLVDVNYKEPAKIKKIRKTFRGEFLGFKTLGVDTCIGGDLRHALLTYNGPNVLITSLRRHWGTSSDHERGRAVDFDLCTSIVDYLVSEEGIAWLKSNNLIYYIEGRPGCREVASYSDRPECKPFIFYNPRATGPHIHVELE